MSPNYMLLGLLFVFLYVDSGSCISCYVCNSYNDTECKLNPPPGKYQTDCTNQRKGSMNMLCRKITQWIDFEVHGMPAEERVIRVCGWEKSDYDDRCYYKAGFGGRQEVCSCTSENCNGASSLQVTSTLGAICVSLGTMYRLLKF